MPPSNTQFLPALQANPWFGNLPVSEQRAMLERAQPVRLPRGAVLYRKGHPECAFYGIVEGLVKISSLAPDGREGIPDLPTTISNDLYAGIAYTPGVPGAGCIFEWSIPGSCRIPSWPAARWSLRWKARNSCTAASASGSAVVMRSSPPPGRGSMR